MEVKVTASKNYSVVIKDDISNFNSYVKDLKGDKVAIITDSNVFTNFFIRKSLI